MAMLCGVQWDYSSDSPLLSRTATILATNGTANQTWVGGDANYNAAMPFGGMGRCGLTIDGTVMNRYGDGCYLDTDPTTHKMVCVPAFYSYVDYYPTASHVNFYISDVPTSITLEGGGSATTSLNPAFTSGGLNVPYLYIGAFEAYYMGGILTSLADVQPTTLTAGGANFSITAARTYAEANGDGWELMTAQTLSMLQLLLIVEYARFDFCTAISQGISNLGEQTNRTGGCNTGHTKVLGNVTGAVGFTSDNVVSPDVELETEAVSYRGIENLWGNVMQFIDGINIAPDSINYSVWVNTTNARPFSSTAHDGDQYKNTGQALINGIIDYDITSFDFSQAAYNWLFIPEIAEYLSLRTQYVCGGVSTSALTAQILLHGGYWPSWAAGVGPFYLDYRSTATYSHYKHAGARIQYMGV